MTVLRSQSDRNVYARTRLTEDGMAWTVDLRDSTTYAPNPLSFETWLYTAVRMPTEAKADQIARKILQ